MNERLRRLFANLREQGWWVLVAGALVGGASLTAESFLGIIVALPVNLDPKRPDKALGGNRCEFLLHILDVRERGDWRNKGGRRFADVYVVTHPRTGRGA